MYYRYSNRLEYYVDSYHTTPKGILYHKNLHILYDKYIYITPIYFYFIKATVAITDMEIQGTYHILIIYIDI